jgi:hypothetical protein
LLTFLAVIGGWVLMCLGAATSQPVDFIGHNTGYFMGVTWGYALVIAVFAAAGRYALRSMR